MKKEIKGFIMGIIATTVIFSTTLTVFSEPITKTIKATYENITLYVDGNLIAPKFDNGKLIEPFTIDGTTYLPARLVAEALGKKVSWDDANKSIYIGKKPYDNSPSEISEFTVSTAEEFVKAIGSNRKIILKPGVYDLSTVYGISENSTVWWDKVSDGKELVVRAISNISIEGDTSGKVEIKTSPRNAEIIHFIGGTNISIKNIVAGHTPSEYTCNSGVLGFERCENVSIDNSEFYGCGSIGISLDYTKEFLCNNTKIDHCSLRALDINGSNDIKFTKSKFVDHEAYSDLIYASNSSEVNFEDCLFDNNNKLTWSLAEVYGNSNISLNKCKITNNIVTNENTLNDKVSMFKTLDFSRETAGKISLKDTEISSNKCESLFDNESNVTFENCKIENNSWQR